MPELRDMPPWVLICAALLGGGGAGATLTDLVGLRVSDAEIARIAKASRPDPFTGADGHTLERKLSGEIRRAKIGTHKTMLLFVCTELRQLRSDMPPSATRKRILNIESALSRAAAIEFDTPDQAWSEPTQPCLPPGPDWQ